MYLLEREEHKSKQGKDEGKKGRENEREEEKLRLSE